MNKIVAITGSTGGLGTAMVEDLAKQGYDLLLLNRSEEKTIKQINALKEINHNININYYLVNLATFSEVKKLAEFLKETHFDYLILNAAIYNCQVKMLETGYNNVFSVNYITNYFLLKELKTKSDFTKIIVVGSIAYNMAKLIEEDVDYSHHTKINKIYGNSKRFLMFSTYKEFENDNRIVIAHPGITYTNITSHYPKWINWFICFGIKVVFPSPKKAANIITSGITLDTKYLEWLSPKVFNIWGKVKIKRIKNVCEEEITEIHNLADNIYEKLK